MPRAHAAHTASAYYVHNVQPLPLPQTHYKCGSCPYRPPLAPDEHTTYNEACIHPTGVTCYRPHPSRDTLSRAMGCALVKVFSAVCYLSTSVGWLCLVARTGYKSKRVGHTWRMYPIGFARDLVLAQVWVDVHAVTSRIAQSVSQSLRRAPHTRAGVQNYVRDKRWCHCFLKKSQIAFFKDSCNLLLPFR